MQAEVNQRVLNREDMGVQPAEVRPDAPLDELVCSNLELGVDRHLVDEAPMKIEDVARGQSEGHLAAAEPAGFIPGFRGAANSNCFKRAAPNRDVLRRHQQVDVGVLPVGWQFVEPMSDSSTLEYDARKIRNRLQKEAQITLEHEDLGLLLHMKSGQARL